MSSNSHQKVPLFGLGIAGNFAGHLQQTGEANALQGAVDASRPQALFPFFVPNATEPYLAVNPYSFDTVLLPSDVNAKVQMEPEIALVVTVKYLGTSVIGLVPESMTLLNDLTHRNAVVSKLAEKKNWGMASKGIAPNAWPLSSFSAADGLGKYRFCSFHARDGRWAACGHDVSLSDYSYCYEQLISWLIEQINQQKNEGALHSIAALLAEAGYPKRMLISLGSSRYTDYGEQHHLLAGDALCAVLYDSSRIDLSQVTELVKTEQFDALSQHHIVLSQRCFAKGDSD